MKDELYAATAPDVSGSEYYGPKWLVRGGVVRVELNQRAKDTIAARFWEILEQLTGVYYEVLHEPVRQYAF